MGVFDDKKFEQLDWMSQITETIESELNGLLARLPDRIEVTPYMLMEEASSSSFSFTVSRVVLRLLGRPGYDLSYEEQSKVCSCFEFEWTEGLEVDLGAMTMNGTLFLVKSTATLTDEVLQGLMGDKGMEAIRSIAYDGQNPPLERMNEILDLLGNSADAIKTRSAKKKIYQIRTRFREIFSKNEWRIRSMVLADKIGHWAAGYIESGNLADFINFTKVKVLTHNNMPIYSIEEEK